MKAHDSLTLSQAQADYDSLCQSYLNQFPDADIDQVVFDAISINNIANTTGITLANVSVYTKLAGIQAALAAVNG